MSSRDYFAILGGFAPQADQDAALKLALDVIFQDHRLDALIDLLAPDSPIGGLEGEPGWSFEMRGLNDIAWPNETRFLAEVAPATYHLAHPRFFCSTAVLRGHLDSLCAAYAKRSPDRADTALRLKAAISAFGE